METDLCSHSFLASSLFSHLPSCPYLCSDYYSRYAAASYFRFIQSRNVQIHKHWWSKNFNVLLLNSFYFLHIHDRNMFNLKDIKADDEAVIVSENSFIFQLCEWTETQSGHPRSPVWKPPGLGCSTPAALLLWGHQKVWSVHSSFS